MFRGCHAILGRSHPLSPMRTTTSYKWIYFQVRTFFLQSTSSWNLVPRQLVTTLDENDGIFPYQPVFQDRQSVRIQLARVLMSLLSMRQCTMCQMLWMKTSKFTVASLSKQNLTKANGKKTVPRPKNWFLRQNRLHHQRWSLYHYFIYFCFSCAEISRAHMFQ